VFAFFLVNLAAFPVVWVTAIVLGECVFVYYLPADWAAAVAHGLAISLPVFANYAFHKFVTFRGA
jgi:hypothetical protein